MILKMVSSLETVWESMHLLKSISLHRQFPTVKYPAVRRKSPTLWQATAFAGYVNAIFIHSFMDSFFSAVYELNLSNQEGEGLVFISCEDFQNYISCSSLDLIIVFAVSHDEGVRGLGVHGGDPPRRSFPQDTWLASAASVPQDEAQSFLFPSPKDKMCHVPGCWCGEQEMVGFILPHYPTLLQLARRAVPVPQWGGEVAGCAWLSQASSVFICPSSASHWKDRMTSSCKCQGEIAMKWCNNVMPWKALVCQCCSHYTKAIFSVLTCQPRKSTQRSASEDLFQLVTSH